MSLRATRLFLLWFSFLSLCPAAAPAADPLDRGNPRSAVTAFLQACQDNDYARAQQYLDLRKIPAKERAEQGSRLAKQLEAILNSDGHFNVLQLSQAPEGNLTDDTNPALEHVAVVGSGASSVTIELERVELTPGAPVWLFSSATVSAIPMLTPVFTESALEARLPQILITIHFLGTPLWKWIALTAVAAAVILLLHLAARLLIFAIGAFTARFRHTTRWLFIQAVLQPWLVLLSVAVFVLAEQFIDPSAISRLYIGRFLLLVIVGAFSWCFINLADLFLVQIDMLIDPRQRVVSHSLIYLGRRAAKVAIVVAAIIIVLDNWGYNMTTMIAGLGVGGIAIALAAQTTIANVFGGVSVIGDSPIMVGDFGNFGGVMGTVEDIGMRSTRVRTLNRTVMSIPNNSFAGMNLENYALRDKILFNPTFQIKRATPKDKIHAGIKALQELLKADPRIEPGPSPIRLTTLTAASFGLEIFAYARTADINDFYKIQADLFLAIDDALTAAGVELA